MSRLVRALGALLLLSAASGRGADPAGPDETALRQMNADYVRAFLTCDVGHFRALLADDFTGVLADGRVIDKAEFLREAREPPDARDLRLHDVIIRVYGETALVGAYVTYLRSGGAQVKTRYSTLYARRAGRWAVVWVQWTRVVGAADGSGARAPGGGDSP
jgi:hypothetical protein